MRIRSLVSAMKMIDCASASTLAITGSSISSGSRPRTRATRSRTSLAATSGSVPRRKRTVIRLSSDWLLEVSDSMPSIPEIDPSRICVTCVSMISALAPRYCVRTETIGSSMFGYSRTVRREYETMPTSTMSRLSTVEKTGRRTKNSKKFIVDFRTCQTSGSASRGACRPMTSTRAPSRSCCWPAWTTLSSPTSPLRISTRPGLRCPSTTSVRTARPSTMR